MLPQFLDNLERGTVSFLGILCFLIFAVNAVLLVWLIVKKSAHGLAKCPRCGRDIACPHCGDEDDSEDPAESA